MAFAPSKYADQNCACVLLCRLVLVQAGSFACACICVCRCCCSYWALLLLLCSLLQVPVLGAAAVHSALHEHIVEQPVVPSMEDVP
jgi:hypothetical protein